MKKQGYNDRLDESLGMKHKGPHNQDMDILMQAITQ